MDWSPQIAALCAQLVEHYVFPEIGVEIADILRKRLAAGAYAGISEDEAFAAAVTEDLQSVNGDKHLRLIHSIDEVPVDDPFDAALYRAEVSLSGYGFARVERLPGNIGYIDTTAFHWPEVAGDRAVAAMTLVADADALVFDVRRNRGGSPGMVALICSYLFGSDELTHLNSIYRRETGGTEQSWTLPYVPGPRFGPDRPVYVLTSSLTFSAAEEFTYDLQTRDRAVIIGERTRGGANPGTRYRVGPHLKSAVPSGRAVNPVRGDNWEGVGVAPDIEVTAEEAFGRAYGLALRHVLTLGENGARRAVAAEARQALAAL
ncbi:MULTISPECIES: S41 family peptidase [Streptosporangium]|uniref:C-terminal processing protease CtpA/Prc n=1 Tax=Streptosporangium brasiliense TaxID=47480 RepID=A0ABT9RMU9_9ACTN|nr:S41 family peptidase [Streptosporangium brasiliense]MDP9869645.1 C-terminal processing protease CtpA/Prc [Streptosporangium brasiliense]